MQAQSSPATITIEPSAPRTGQDITAVIRGEWPTSCKPGQPTVSRDGNVVVVEATANPACASCLSVVTPYELRVPIGRFTSATTFSILFFVRDCETRSRNATGNFTVTATAETGSFLAVFDSRWRSAVENAGVLPADFFVYVGGCASGLGGAISISLQTVDGSATAGSDYQHASIQYELTASNFGFDETGPGWLSLSPFGDLPITILNDSIMEPAEQFAVRVTISSNTLRCSQSGAPVGPRTLPLVFDVSFSITDDDTRAPDPQASVQFTASPSAIRAGQSTTLVFSTQNAVSVTIDNGVTVSGTSGSVTVTPSQTTTYTLTATSAAGTRTTAQVTVTVITTPAVIVSALPQGMLQSAGVGGATDRVSLTNVGGSPATISFTQTGSFFTIAPTSLTIAPGATETVTITASAQPSGAYDGSITASGSGIQGALTIPVRLLVSAPPQGTVIPTPQTNRVDVTQPAGSLQITNSGSATLQGILVSDVPWLIPQGGVITIGPGQSVTVTFSIDRTKRPDGENPIGAVTGSMTLVYLDTPSSGATVGMIQALEDTPATGTEKALVVDLAALAPPSTGPIPSLGSGEIALFLPGLAKKANLVSDLILANRIPDSLATRLFFAASGVPTTSVPQTLALIVPFGKVLLSDVINGVFNRPEGEAGGVQVRAGNPTRLNFAAVVTNPVNPAGLFGGSIASQRSDRGIGFNEKTVLTGVRKDAGARTDLYVQEVAGQGGSVRTDFLREDGTVLKTRTDPIGAFAILELANEAPSGAVSAGVTNLGSVSRIIAQGLVFDEQTGDPTNLVDWNRRNGTAATETQIVLLAASGVAGGKKTRTDVWITNVGSATATGTLSFYGGSTRRRPVRRSTGGSSAGVGRIESMEVSKTITVEAGKTRVIRDVLSTEFSSSTASGYLLYTTLSGTVAITSGTFKDPITAQPGASGSSGTSVAVMASSTGLKLGETRQFGSLRDASAATIATAEQTTYRTGFGLVETSGKSVTVKVTLRYQSVVPGDLASNPLSVSKEYALIPRGSIFVDRIGRSIFGPERDTKFGDLHDLVLEIAVTAGEGRVIPYTLATENGSGDTIMRIE